MRLASRGLGDVGPGWLCHYSPLQHEPPPPAPRAIIPPPPPASGWHVFDPQRFVGIFAAMYKRNAIAGLALVLVVTCAATTAKAEEVKPKGPIPSYAELALQDVVWSTRAEDQARLALADELRRIDPRHPVLALEAIVSARRRGAYREAMEQGLVFFRQLPVGVEKDLVERAICGDALRAHAATELAQQHPEWTDSLLVQAGRAADLDQVSAILGVSSKEDHGWANDFRLCVFIVQQQWAQAADMARRHQFGETSREMVAILAVDDQNTAWQDNPGLASFVLLHAEALGDLKLADAIMDAGVVAEYDRNNVGYLAATVRREGMAALLERTGGDRMSWMPQVLLRGRQSQDAGLWKQLSENDRRTIVNLWAKMGCVKDYEWGSNQLVDKGGILPITDEPTPEEVALWYAPDGHYFRHGAYAAEALPLLLQAQAYDAIEPWLLQGFNEPNGEYLLRDLVDAQAWQPFFSLASPQLNAHPLWRMHRARLCMANGDLSAALEWAHGLDPTETDLDAMARLTLWVDLPFTEDPVTLLLWATANTFPSPVAQEAHAMRRWVARVFADDVRQAQFLTRVDAWFDQTHVGSDRSGLYAMAGFRQWTYADAARARGDHQAASGLDVLHRFAEDAYASADTDLTYSAYAIWAAACGREQSMARALIHLECFPRNVSMADIHDLPFVSDALSRASPDLQRKWYISSEP